MRISDLRSDVCSSDLATSGLNPQYDVSEVTPKIASFQTLTDAKPLQQQIVVLADNVDYLYQRSNLKESVIQSRDTYKYNWVWVDDFQRPGPYANRYSNLTNEELGRASCRERVCQ